MQREQKEKKDNFFSFCFGGIIGVIILTYKNMFFGIIIIAVGVAILLNTLGLMTGNFWGFFWAAFFIIVGIKMIVKREGGCPMCGGFMRKSMHVHGENCNHDHE